jgi:ADP-heptose:LPS heptosyltransferase
VSFKKILIIRFSSIGDIVLTTPIIRCLKKQHKCIIHYVTKFKYLQLIELNPYIDKTYSIQKNVSEIILDLKKENYDYIVDLHNNFRSFFLKTKLNVSSNTIYKQSFEKWLYINTGLNLLSGTHVVDKYFKTIKKITINNDGEGLDYFIDPLVSTIPNTENLDFNKKYIVWILGGTYSNKRLSKNHILDICNRIDFPVVFLGGKEEFLVGDGLVKNRMINNTYNLCGKLTFDESAWVIKRSELVLTNDTGFMHVSAAFQKKIISFWGCTKPVLGMSPYVSEELSVKMIANPEKTPCSKLGDRCRYSQNGCINDINTDNIYKEILRKI